MSLILLQLLLNTVLLSNFFYSASLYSSHRIIVVFIKPVLAVKVKNSSPHIAGYCINTIYTEYALQ